MIAIGDNGYHQLGSCHRCHHFSGDNGANEWQCIIADRQQKEVVPFVARAQIVTMAIMITMDRQWISNANGDN